MMTNRILEALSTNRRQFLTLSGIAGILFLSGQPKISFTQTRRAEGLCHEYE
jgi:hypothetical protein